MQHQGKVPGGDVPLTLGSVFVEANQESSEILIFVYIHGRITQLSVMADLYPSMVLGYSFLSWNRYRTSRKSAMDFIKGVPRSPSDYCGLT